MRKINYTYLVLLFCSSTIFGQNSNEFNLIKLDATWGQEVLRFPARNMDYIGVGEVRFPPNGWRDPAHKNFWSYTYAWKIDVNREIPTSELEIDLVKYFNSLNHIDMADKTNEHYATASVLKAKKDNETTFFKGTVNIFDRFATHKMITLYVSIESRLCKKEKSTTLLFKFSPKNFTHETWNTTLKKVELYDDLCHE